MGIEHVFGIGGIVRVGTTLGSEGEIFPEVGDVDARGMVGGTLGSVVPVPTVLFLRTLFGNRLASCARVSVVDSSIGSRSGVLVVEFRTL